MKLNIQVLNHASLLSGPMERTTNICGTLQLREVEFFFSFLNLLSLSMHTLSFLSMEDKWTWLGFMPAHTIIVLTITPQLLKNYTESQLEQVNTTSPAEEPLNLARQAACSFFSGLMGTVDSDLQKSLQKLVEPQPPSPPARDDTTRPEV